MNRTYLLLAEFETTDIPLKTVAAKYFGLNEEQAGKWARAKKFPFPVFRGGSQKSDWLVSVTDLADYLNQQHEQAKEEFKLING